VLSRRGIRRRLDSISSKETSISVVAAKPEPGDRVSLQDTQRSHTARYPHGPDSFLGVDAFEAERGVEGILKPQFEGLTSAAPN
jgi:hypothetical protein